jgi:hypothetical protein
MREYIVKPLMKEEEVPWDYPTLPKPPFRILNIAPSNTGKSVLTSYMLGSDELPYKKYFKTNIFLFSPTMRLGSMQMPDIKEENIFDSFDVNTIEAIKNEQVALVEKYGKKKSVPLLFVLDDVIADLDKERKETLKRLYFGIRHYNGSIIMLVQQYKAVPKGVRMNASDTIIMLLASLAERKAVAEEQPHNEKEFLAILDEALEDQQYSFLMIRHKNPKKTRYQLRLSNVYLT